MTVTRVLETIPKRKLSLFGLAIKFLRDRDPKQLMFQHAQSTDIRNFDYG